ncbi:hypothetical protein [Gordonia hirsuta]|uniref:hypothetical protein n=1 Tax=Gordonia hirsuta TaxID=53427 RepID=UPI0012DCE001|nr:hypothetical protein [Gordonia hirsuta]
MTVPSLPPRAPAALPPSAEPGDKPSRPESVLILIQLTVFAVLCWVIAMPGSYSSAHKQALTMVKDQSEKGTSLGDPDVVARMVTIAGIAVSAVVLVALVAGLLALLLRGKGWARFLLGWITALLTVMMVFDVIAVVFGDGGETETLPAWAMVARIIGGVAALGASLAAMHPDTRKFVEQVAAFRSRSAGTRQGRNR